MAQGNRRPRCVIFRQTCSQFDGPIHKPRKLKCITRASTAQTLFVKPVRKDEVLVLVLMIILKSYILFYGTIFTGYPLKAGE